MVPSKSMNIIKNAIVSKHRSYFNPYLQDTQNLLRDQLVDPGLTKIYICYTKSTKTIKNAIKQVDSMTEKLLDSCTASEPIYRRQVSYDQQQVNDHRRLIFQPSMQPLAPVQFQTQAQQYANSWMGTKMEFPVNRLTHFRTCIIEWFLAPHRALRLSASVNV